MQKRIASTSVHPTHSRGLVPGSIQRRHDHTGDICLEKPGRAPLWNPRTVVAILKHSVAEMSIFHFLLAIRKTQLVWGSKVHSTFTLQRGNRICSSLCGRFAQKYNFCSDHSLVHLRIFAPSKWSSLVYTLKWSKSVIWSEDNIYPILICYVYLRVS